MAVNTPEKQERIDVFKNSVRFKNKKRIIKFSNVMPWMVYDCGLRLNETARNYELRTKMIEEFQKRYNFDAYADYWTRNPSRISDVLGNSLYDLDDETYGVNFKDITLFGAQDYPILLRDYKEFLWTRIMPNKFDNLTNEDAIDKIKEAMKEFTSYQNYIKSVVKIMNEKYNVLNLFAGRGFYPMFDNLFKNWRGIKNLSIDLRKNKEVLLEVANKYFLMGTNTDDLELETEYGSTEFEGNDISFSMLSHTILNNKQFEEYFYPCLKFVFNYAEKYDKIVRFMIQGESERLWDYFQEAPKGHFIFQLEMDDIFKAKKILGHVACLAGGMSTDLLYHGTPQENVDYAKKLVNEVGYDGAFMITSNKMLCFPNDCKRENLFAVHDYISNLSLS